MRDIVLDVDCPRSTRRKVEKKKAEPQKGNPKSRETEAPSARRDAIETPRLSRRPSRSSPRLYVCTIELDFFSNWPSWFSFRSRSSPPFTGIFFFFFSFLSGVCIRFSDPFRKSTRPSFARPFRSLLRRQIQGALFFLRILRDFIFAVIRK